MTSDRTVLDRAGPRALVVDDDADLRVPIGLALTGPGWAVTEASAAIGAVILARRGDPRVVVLDPDLADGDGCGVLDQLQSVAETASIPVVVLSTRTDARQ